MKFVFACYIFQACLLGNANEKQKAEILDPKGSQDTKTMIIGGFPSLQMFLFQGQLDSNPLQHVISYLFEKEESLLDKAESEMVFQYFSALKKAESIGLRNGINWKNDQLVFPNGHKATKKLKKWIKKGEKEKEIQADNHFLASLQWKSEGISLVLGREWVDLPFALPDSKTWENDFFETFINKPITTRGYLPLFFMDPEVVEAMLNCGYWNWQGNKPEMYYFFIKYGTLLQIDGGAIQTPGTEDNIWTEFIDTPPKQICQFLEDLFSEKRGVLAEFFFDCMRLSPELRSRILFEDIEDQARRKKNIMKIIRRIGKINPTLYKNATPQFNSLSFYNLAKVIEVNEDGDFQFPGGKDIWELALKSDQPILDVQDLQKSLSKKVKHIDEDKLVNDLLTNTIETHQGNEKSFERFIKVSNFFKLRPELLSDKNILLLYRNNAEFDALTGYFVRLPFNEAEQLTDHLFQILNLVTQVTEQNYFEIGLFLNASQWIVNQYHFKNLKQETATDLLLSLPAKLGQSQFTSFFFKKMNQDIHEGNREANHWASQGAFFKFEWEGEAFQYDSGRYLEEEFSVLLKKQSITPFPKLYEVYLLTEKAQLARKNEDVEEFKSKVSKVFDLVQNDPELDFSKLDKAIFIQKNFKLKDLSRELKKALKVKKTKHLLQQDDFFSLIETYLNEGIYELLLANSYLNAFESGGLPVFQDPNFIRSHSYGILERGGIYFSHPFGSSKYDELNHLKRVCGTTTDLFRVATGMKLSTFILPSTSKIKDGSLGQAMYGFFTALDWNQLDKEKQNKAEEMRAEGVKLLVSQDWEKTRKGKGHYLPSYRLQEHNILVTPSDLFFLGLENKMQENETSDWFAYFYGTFGMSDFDKNGILDLICEIPESYEILSRTFGMSGLPISKRYGLDLLLHINKLYMELDLDLRTFPIIKEKLFERLFRNIHQVSSYDWKAVTVAIESITKEDIVGWMDNAMEEGVLIQ